MRSEIRKLIDRWNEMVGKLCYVEYPEASGEDLKKYSKLMVETFPYVKEMCEKGTATKDVIALLMTISSMFERTDDEGNYLGDEICDQITSFHGCFIQEVTDYETLTFDEDGNLILHGPDEGNEFTVNPATFELPSIDEIYGFED